MHLRDLDVLDHPSPTRRSSDLVEAQRVRPKLLRALDPSHIRLGQHLACRRGDVIQGVDRVVGVEFRAIVEIHVVPELELHGGLVDPLERLREQWLVFEGLDVAEHEHVPNHPVDNDDLADVAVEGVDGVDFPGCRSEEHTSELQSLMRLSYAVFCLKKKKKNYK